MSWITPRLIAAASFALASTVALAPAAHAQSTRTFVSAVGDDANPCSRTAPCRTFATAFDRTATNGEINCIDVGSFGPITITRSMMIDCTSTIGRIIVNAGSAITINAGETDRIVLRGLQLSGLTTGSSAIRVLQVGSLRTDNVHIRGFQTGINFVTGNPARLSLVDVLIEDITTGSGVHVQPAAPVSLYATLQNVRILGSQSYGFSISAGFGSVFASITDSTISDHSTSGVSMVTNNPAYPGRLIVKNSQIVYNGTGISVTGGNLIAGLSNTTVTGNNVGIATSGVSPALGIRTFGSNQLAGNSVDGVFTGTIPQQ